MKHLLLCLFTIFSFKLLCQFKIEFHKSLFEKASNNQYKWEINGKQFTVTNKKIKLKTNYPLTDTIYFSSNKYSFNIITRFKPQESYIFHLGDCDAGFEIYTNETFKRIQLSKVKGNEEEIKSESDNINDDFYKVKVQLKNKNNSDSLFVFFGDVMAPILNCYLLENNNETNWIYGHHAYCSTQYSTLYLFYPEWIPEEKHSKDDTSYVPDWLAEDFIYEENILILHPEKWKFVLDYGSKRADVIID